MWFAVGNAEGRLFGQRLQITVNGERQPDQMATNGHAMYKALARASGYVGCGDGCEHELCWLPRRAH
jgi:hypothetical protein